MEVGRQITFWFIVCYCVNIIYTEEPADNAATTPSNEELSNRSELETGNLSGIIEAHKNGTKLKLKIHTKVFWKNDKSIDSMTCKVPAVEKKGDKGDKGDIGTPGINGKMGQKGSNGTDGLKGDKGEDGPKGIKGEMGQKGNNGTDGLKGDKGEIGPQGIQGEMGQKGSNGTDGLKGDKGEDGPKGIKGEMGPNGTCAESCDGRTKKNYGTKENPAYSCSDVPENGLFYVNIARSFKVYCNSYNTYISENPTSISFTNLEKNNEVWLSSKNLDLKQFYGTSLPNLSYLMLTNVGFKLTLTYSDEVEILKILSWTGITKSIPLSNGCESIKQKNDLEITCTPANYLPMDFYIKAKDEEVSINLKSLYFY